MKNNLLKLLLASVFTVTIYAAHAEASTLGLAAMARSTGLNATPTSIQNTWADLQTMGTTEFVGGQLGNFKLDESSLIAGAMTVGVTEFDNFLRTGKLDISLSDIGNILTKNMTSAAGIDLSSVTGSFTSGGGVLSATKQASITNTGGGALTAENCPPEVSQKLVDQANSYIDNMVSVASSEDYGFSSLSSATGGTTGFAGLSCLDKLFQNAGSDLLFKPPSLGNLTSQLQNWTCGQAVPIGQQIADAFPSGIQSSMAGGFFPDVTSADANQNNPLAAPGINNSSAKIFGEKFVNLAQSTQDEMKKINLNSLFK